MSIKKKTKPVKSGPVIAAIYARVSTKKQVKEGNGIKSQIRTCYEHCETNGFEVVATFTDDSTGGSDDHEGLRLLKAWTKKNRKNNCIVVFDSLSRVGRDVQVYTDLKRFVIEQGAEFSCPTFHFDGTPEGELRENITVSVNQYYCQSNAEQVKRRQRARLLDGYWCLSAPLGYRSDGKGKPMILDERLAPVIKAALEGFAYGSFQTQEEARRFIEQQPEFQHGRKCPRVGNTLITRTLQNVLYTGHVAYAPWDVSLRKGQHEPLITMQTFEAIQERLDGKPKVPRRADAMEDFPLRGFVLCDECGSPLTGGWSKGKKRSYPYYRCFKKTCSLQGKSVRADHVEEEFVDLLQHLAPSEDTIRLSRAMLSDLWDQKQKAAGERRRELTRQIKSLDEDIERLLDRLVETQIASVSSAYEQRVQRLQREKAIAEEKQAELANKLPCFEKMFEHTIEVLSSPCDIWKKGDPTWKSAVLKAVFAERLQYRRNCGFRTPKTTFPFKVLGGSIGEDDILAERTRPGLNVLPHLNHCFT